MFAGGRIQVLRKRILFFCFPIKANAVSENAVLNFRFKPMFEILMHWKFYHQQTIYNSRCNIFM